MASFYPHKQTVIISIVCILAVGAAAYRTYESTTSTSDHLALQAPTIATTSINTIQTNDDWKKQFLTDYGSRSISATSSKTRLSDPTLTDRFGQTIFTNYLELRQANLLNNDKLVNQATENTITSSINTVRPKTYTATDVRTTTDTATSRAAYSATIVDVISMYDFKTGEADILQEYISGNDPQTLHRLDPITARYKQMTSSLLSTPVPASLIKGHVQLLNAVGNLGAASAQLRVSDTDTMQGLVGVALHTQGAQGMINAMKTLHEAFVANGTDFAPDQSIFNVMLK